MAVGTSGRIVIDIDPGLKRRLHAALLEEGSNLKNWFLDRCNDYLAERGQTQLFPRSQSIATPGGASVHGERS